MQLGLFTPIFNTLTFDQLLTELRRYPQIQQLELGTGGFPGDAHLSLSLLDNQAAARSLLTRLADQHLTLSALACHSNPVHPDPATAAAANTLIRDTIRLAEQLEIPTVVTFSGCPGGGPDDRTPNWITAAWPPEYTAALDWQWTERLVPYWRDTAAFAADHGVRIALEAHPGFCVYNPDTLLRLRSATSPALGINLDPSHLWWQGVDIPEAITLLGPAIHHFHAKDVALHPAEVGRNGVLDTRSFTRLGERSWLFRSVGWGHDELAWKQIISALRLAGYDGVLSIEHEDALASTHEGLSSAIALLSRVLLTEPPVEAAWA